MTGVRCVWANVPEAAEKDYEKDNVPDLAIHAAKHALHCEVVKFGLETEFSKGNLDSWRWLTVYESKDVNKTLDGLQNFTDKVLASPIQDLRLDTRTYEEITCWKDEDWNGDALDIASMAVMQWSIKPGKEKEVLDFYEASVGPTMISSPDVLSFRYFRIRDATVLKGTQETLNKEELHSYLTICQLDCDEWPWDVVVAVGEHPKWNEYFEQRKAVDWRSSHYLVNRAFVDGDGSESS